MDFEEVMNCNYTAVMIRPQEVSAPRHIVLFLHYILSQCVPV